VCGGCTSSSCDVLSGVLQGSILGPLLFLTYINDITQELSSINICCLYADDCLLYRKITSFADVSALEADLKLLELREKKLKMSFNIDKCMVLSITIAPYVLITHFMGNILLQMSMPNTWVC